MRRAITVLAVVVLLAGPTALAFFQGGYFDLARLVAGLVAWALFGIAALTSPRPLPRSTGGRLALAGLVLLTVWTGASIAWAPLSTPAVDALQRLLLYVAVLGAAAALLREPWARRATEPALALGVLLVVGYGLSERLLPGVFDLKHSAGALGRLEQPLTYWNAMGGLSAIGVILCVRTAGDDSRPRWMRAAASAGAVPIAVGLWLSYSRGSLAALAVGLLALAALSLTKAQLRAIAIALVTGALAAAGADSLDGVRALEGSRERDGLVMLAALVLLCGLAAGATWLSAKRPVGPLALPRWGTVAIAACIFAAGAGVIAVAARDRGHSAASGANADRLRSLESNRYNYWKVALADGFAKHPLNGTGAGGFAVIWLQYRDVPERAQVAHSLYIETLAELGLVGFAFLAVFIAGVAMVARRPGPAAALLAFATHSALDWDWQMPALTLVALVLAGYSIADFEETVA